MSENNKAQAKTPEEKEDIWLDQINKEADEKATELGKIFECKVKPVVYVVEPLKDAAVGFVKLPDAAQGMKLIRFFAEEFDAGLVLAAKAQLIRAKDMAGRVEGKAEVSDPRFMDEKGGYDKVNDSMLNMGLLLEMQQIVQPYVNAFKKK